MRALTIVATLGVVVLFGTAARDGDTWKKIENKSFSFSVPSSFTKTDTRGIDSFVEEYVADGIQLSFDLGIYANQFDDWPKDTRFENLIVHGKAARIGTVTHEFQKGFPYSTQIYISASEDVALSMFAACKSEKEVALARKIFQTITFNAKQAQLSMQRSARGRFSY